MPSTSLSRNQSPEAEHLREHEQAEIRAVARQWPTFGRRLPEMIRRHRDDDRDHLRVQIEWQLPEVLTRHLNRAMLRKQGLENDDVLLFHRPSELRQSARR